jgi:hypothetical protein
MGKMKIVAPDPVQSDKDNDNDNLESFQASTCITIDGKHPHLHRCKCFAVCELCLEVVENTKDIDSGILKTECGLYCKNCE